MNSNNKMAQQYQESQILNASPTERVVLCYDGAIKFLLHAKAAMAAGNIEERYKKVQKAYDVVCYLQDTLDYEKGGKISEQLSKYYTYLLGRMVDINVEQDVEILDEVVKLLKTMRQSWVKIAEDQKQTEDAANDLTGKDEKTPPVLAVNSSV